jgi:hypothetical protein
LAPLVLDNTGNGVLGALFAGGCAFMVTGLE